MRGFIIKPPSVVRGFMGFHYKSPQLRGDLLTARDKATGVTPLFVGGVSQKEAKEPINDPTNKDFRKEFDGCVLG